MRADQLDGTYPRPTMRREQWLSLEGTWQFAYDDADVGLGERWFTGTSGYFTRQIVVPFPPESPASGIGDTGRHPVLWYSRTLSAEACAVDDEYRRVLLHFGAVDYRAQVWLDGQLVATHVGGQTPFSADLTDVLVDGAEHVIVVRAEDDPDAVDQPRGKQDWRDEPHGIWYGRTTGIWQPVWLEQVPQQRITDIAWSSDPAAGLVRAEITLSARPKRGARIEITLSTADEVLADVSVSVRTSTATVVLAVASLRHGQDRERLLWSPESPTLVDAQVVLRDRESGTVLDAVDSYLGLRSSSVGGGSFLLNGQPYYTRAVLNQGFRPRTHLASSGSDELRKEVEQIKAMGFNAVRVHQKAEDPRFLYWADRLGLLVWAETAAAFEFSSAAIDMLITEWLRLVQRDRSHPSVVVWVPVNESWGVQDIATDPAQQHFSRSLAQLTRALDPTRPVVSNEGWEHLDSDILGVHDYTVDPDQLRARYATEEAAATTLTGYGPQGRRVILSEDQTRSFDAGRAPLMITEFGGISLTDDDGAWGYGIVASDAEFAALLTRLFAALRASRAVVGFCYTQFMDTGQETNGLLYSDGTPKLPIPKINSIVTGSKDPCADAPEPDRRTAPVGAPYS